MKLLKSEKLVVDQMLKMSECLYDVMPRRKFIRALGIFAFAGIYVRLATRVFADDHGDYKTITCPSPCTVKGTGSSGPNCGNAGFYCSGVIDTTNPKCCQCPPATNNACPAGLTASGGGWVACCLCTEATPNAANQGRVFTYHDCCGKNPGSKTCPNVCYQVGSDRIAETGYPCPAGPQAAPDQGWCSTGQNEYCTLPGAQSNQCCQWT